MTQLVLMGDAKKSCGPVAELLRPLGYEITINEGLSPSVPMLVCVTLKGANDLGKTLKPLKKAAGQACMPIGIFVSTAGEDVEEELLEMLEGELRSILASVTSEAVLDILPYFSTLSADWETQLKELCQLPPAGSVALQPPNKKILKKSGLKHLLK